jgi:tetratricopeptide (TPR) repeat protein
MMIIEYDVWRLDSPAQAYDFTMTCPSDQPEMVLAEVQRLYESGLYLDSFAAGQALGDIRHWPGITGQILAGRLAYNLGAPRLGRAIHWLAQRRWPDDPQSIYYGSMANWARMGSYHTWCKIAHQELPADADIQLQADWAALKAVILGLQRDFSRADQWMQRALELTPDSPWLQVELSDLLDRQDRHQEGLAAALRALELKPWYRPAVQSAGYKLVQLRRDQEALELLSSAAVRLQSGEVWCQLAMLQMELKEFDAAWQSIQHAQSHWPLASADSAHQKWLTAQMSDLAYFRGDYQQSLELARRLDRPFYQQLVEQLERALSQHPVPASPRIQLSVPFVRQHHETCAPATLTALALYWNQPAEHDTIAQRICYEGTAACDERRWAEDNGFLAREFRITQESAERLIRAGIPFTLNTVEPGSAHLQSVVGIDVYRGTLLIQDPGERHVGEAALDKLLEHYSSTGPRGMAIVPKDLAQRLQGIELADAALYDLLYHVDCSLTQHQRSNAWQAIEQMIQLAPEHRLTLQAQTAVARYDGNSPELLRLTEQLLQQFPDDANLQLVRLGCLSELGTRDQRIQSLRSICQSDQGHPIFWARLAVELLEDRRTLPEAKWRLRRILRAHQMDGRSLALWGNLMWEEGERSVALESYRLAAAASEKDESYSRSYFSAARCLGETQQALQWLRDRLGRLGSLSTQPARTLASALDMLDRTQEQFELLEAAATQHPDDGDLHCLLASLFSRYNLTEKSLRHLQLAEGKCPKGTQLRTGASVALNQGRLQDARDLLIQVHQQDPLDTHVLDQLVNLDRDLQGEEAALQRLKDAVAKFPHSYSIQVSLIQWLRNFRVQQAALQLDHFLLQHPGSAWGWREAAIVALLTHQMEAGRSFADRAIEADPHNDTGYYIRGRIALDEGQLDQAGHFFRLALEKNCDNDSAIAALLDTCQRPDDRKKQLDFVLDQLRLQTTFGSGILAYREVAVGKIESEAILAGLEEAIQFRPDLWHCWSALTHQLLAVNQRQRAVSVAVSATEKFPLTPRIWLDLALVHRAMNNEVGELAALQNAHQINPHWVDVARELSDFYLKQKNYPQAEHVIRSVLNADPRNPVALASLADCLYQSGQQQAAIQPLREACQLAPGYTWAWQTLTEWSRQIDDGSSVKQAAEFVMTSRPNDHRGFLRYAESCDQVPEIPQGLQMIQRALELEPRDVDSHNLKAYYLGRLHQWDEALAACQPAVFGDQLPVALQMRQAGVLQHKGQTAAAVEVMQAALRLDPDHYPGWHQLADWADELGDLELYKTAGQNLLRLNPHQPFPYGYLADALLRDSTPATQAESRKLAKQYLLTAIQISPNYSYATGRLVVAELQDNAADAAQQALDLGGQYLTDGFRESYQVQISAQQAANDPQAQKQVINLLVDWCQKGPHNDSALLQAVDSFSQELVQKAITQLVTQIGTACESTQLGLALGQLIARHQKSRQAIQTIKQIPVGAAWNSAVGQYLRNIPHLDNNNQRLDSLLRRFSKPLKQDEACWAIVSSTLLNMSRNNQAVQWTKDWQQRQSPTLVGLVNTIASRWENFRVDHARQAIDYALDRFQDSDDAYTVNLIHVWAGLDTLLRDRSAQAIQHAQSVQPRQLSGWYLVGYQILVTAIELHREVTQNPANGASACAKLEPMQLVSEPRFQRDRLTGWILCQLQGQLAQKSVRTWSAWWYQVRAFRLKHGL